MDWPRYRKRPIVVEAVQLAVGNRESVAERCGGTNVNIGGWWGISIPTLEGAHLARPGDWIIKGVLGEFYPCKPDIFAATYESAE